jgi:hypothetical protein
MQNRLFLWVFTIFLASGGGALLMAVFLFQRLNDPGILIFSFVGLLCGLTALALYVHKLRPKQA